MLVSVGFNYVKFCLILGGGVNRQEREVTLTLKHGVEAKNYDDVCYMARNIEYRGIKRCMNFDTDDVCT